MKKLSIGKALDLSGKQFNRLYVLGYSHKQGSKRMHKCECDCGRLVYIETSSLVTGKTKSCGCFSKEKGREVCIKRNATHGKSKIKAYTIWHDMMRRCYDPKRKGFRFYGAKGIFVSKEWHKFESFLEDMGDAPEGLSLERINRLGPDSKENCKWADIFEQANNRSNNRILIIGGQKYTVGQASKKFNINYFALRSRIQRGWSQEKALSTPINWNKIQKNG